MPSLTAKEHHRLALALALSAFLAGCGGGSGESSIAEEPAPAVQGLLIPAGSTDTLVKTLTGSFTNIAQPPAASGITAVFDNALGTIAAPALPANGQTATYSTTYTQESDVDEFDVVKYDRQRMFIAPRRGFYQLAAPTLVALPIDANVADATSAIRILVTDPENAAATESARIELEDNVTVQGMYVHNNRLAALTSDSYFGGWGSVWLSASFWQNQKNGITLFDVSDSNSPTQVWEASLDGSLIDSRRVGDTIYLFTRFGTYLQGLVDRPQTEEQRQSNEDLLSTVEPNALLPKIRINDVEQDLLQPADCLITNTSSEAAGRSASTRSAASNSIDETGSPVLTLITAIDINDPSNLQTLCYNEQAYGLYASSTSVYFTQLLFGNEPNSEQTRIHKFALQGLAYQGSAEIPGLLWSGGQFDFRANEHNGDLRVVTTRSTGDTTDALDHELHILRQASDRPELEIVASLPNQDQPSEIGKPNEALYGVRFFGDRAYAVTFEQIDPLYVLDLANPSDPQIAGELEVTGFSDFLHPVNAGLLLGFGVTEDRALKLELFDVSNIAAPRSLAVERLGGPSSFSEALYDRHAFTYLPNVTRGDVTVDRFAIPADLYSEAPFAWNESGLYLYEIGNTDSPAAATLNRAGALVFDTPTAERPWPMGGRYRSILDGDAVYLLRNQEVFSTFWNDATSPNGPL